MFLQYIPEKAPFSHFRPSGTRKSMTLQPTSSLYKILFWFSKKNVSNFVFLASDNENLNKAIVNELNTPLLGCDSYRLNLAVKQFLRFYEQKLLKIHYFVKKLTGLKKSGALRGVTNLRPVMRNDTRWSSTFEMLSRYFELVFWIILTMILQYPLPAHQKSLSCKRFLTN